MPYISPELFRLALRDLGKDYSPLLTVSLPCMLANQVPVCKSSTDAIKEAKKFGSREEKEWLDKYFKPSGGPPGLPYYMPGTKEWVQDRYPGRALQRRRKDFAGSVFFHPTDETWAIRRGAAKILKTEVLKNNPPIPLIALLAWMWRDRELKSLESALHQFVRENSLEYDEIIGTLYTDSIPGEYKDAGLVEEPMTQELFAELIGAASPPPVIPDLPHTIDEIETHLKKQHVVLIPGLVSRILGGWLVGDIVVLVGAPGTGKTFLTNILGDALGALFGHDRFLCVRIDVNRDYDLAQFLGYENLSGEFVPGSFAREVLFQGQQTDPRLVILDEWNLAQIDSYFAPILSVVETKGFLSLPGKVTPDKFPNSEDLRRFHPELSENRCGIPEDTFFIATCNSWVDEPETRLPLSGPVKRRSRIIWMPNVLELEYQAHGPDGIIGVCNTILNQEKESIEKRKIERRPSLWDNHRIACLNLIDSAAQLNEKTRMTLVQVSRLLLDNPHTRNFYSVGLLRDVLLSCVYAGPGADFDALGEEIADKILPQVQGETKILEIIVDLTKDFPNAKGITELAKRMGAYSAERRIRPLV